MGSQEGAIVESLDLSQILQARFHTVRNPVQDCRALRSWGARPVGECSLGRSNGGIYLQLTTARYICNDLSGERGDILKTARTRDALTTDPVPSINLDSRDANSTYQGRTTAAREAINYEIQGSAADLIKRAMLGVRGRLADQSMRARMLLTVHDELVFEAPPEEVKPLARLVREDCEFAGQELKQDEWVLLPFYWARY